MAELNLGISSEPIAETKQEENKRLPRLAHATIALLLSTVFPGLGQLYNRQREKGMWIAVSIFLSGLLLGATRVMFIFWGMVFSLTAFLAWRIFVMADAFRGAWRKEPLDAPSPRKWKTYSFAIVIIILTTVPASGNWRKVFPYFHAFVISSSSMYPTLSVHDRVVADMGAFRKRAPQRGEIILFNYNGENTLFAKRVVGIAGDTVSPGLNNEILVNGKTVLWPAACGKPNQPEGQSSELPDFKSVKVPEGSLFVVGDNLANSFDSRMFGFVTLDRATGKPLYLYWSREFSRIGCSIR
jgi:signal peptidase I